MDAHTTGIVIPSKTSAISNNYPYQLSRHLFYVILFQVKIMINSRLRKMGLRLPNISLDDSSPIQVDNPEDFELFIQLDNTRAVRIR